VPETSCDCLTESGRYMLIPMLCNSHNASMLICSMFDASSCADSVAMVTIGPDETGEGQASHMPNRDRS
jgi:hypothetical protein